MHHVGDQTKAIEKLKTTITLQKNRACNTPQIKPIKMSHELSLISLETQHNKPEHKHLKFITTIKTPSVKKISNLHGIQRII